VICDFGLKPGSEALFFKAAAFHSPTFSAAEFLRTETLRYLATRYPMRYPCLACLPVGAYG